MIELGPEAKSLLDAARGADEPTAEDHTRVRAAIAARLLIGMAAGGATAAATKSAAAASMGTAAGSAGAAMAVPIGVATKVVLSIVLVTAVGVGTAVVVRAKRSAIASMRAPTILPVLLRPGADPIRPAAFAGLPSAATASAKPAVEGVQRRTSPAVGTADSARTAIPPTDVEAEVLLLRDAHNALQSGDALPALILLNAHARQYPDGALAEERDASRIAALCALGRIAEARAAVDRFVRAFPNSLHATRVHESCGAATPTL